MTSNNNLDVDALRSSLVISGIIGIIVVVLVVISMMDGDRENCLKANGTYITHEQVVTCHARGILFCINETVESEVIAHSIKNCLEDDIPLRPCWAKKYPDTRECGP